MQPSPPTSNPDRPVEPPVDPAPPGAFDERTAIWLRRAIVASLFGGLLVIGFIVLRPFLVVIAWGAILAYASWPLHMHLRAALKGRRAWAATLMTLLLTAVFGLSLFWMGLLLRRELVLAVGEFDRLLQAGITVPEPIARIPWIGVWLQERVAELGGDREAVGQQLSTLIEQWGGRLARGLGDIGLNALMFGIALVAAFFFFRDGDRLLDQLRRFLYNLLGARVHVYLKAVGDTTRAVVYGLLLAALSQGTLAGLGYWAAGVTAPVFWGAVTMLIALIPFGAPLVWGSIGLWLLATGRVAEGIGLLLWGMLVVSWIDNLVRPLVIGHTANIPFLIVLFGVLGGLAAFGLIGLFVGPVVLAVLLALWREWLAEHSQPATGAPLD